jgi:NDP-sugar pyrophosphorylase family protein
MKRAVILAGGRGTRLRPYTVSLLKPLMPIVDHPILEIIIRELVRAGFEHVTFNVNDQAEIFRTYFGHGSKWRILIDYSLERQPFGTMGRLR